MPEKARWLVAVRRLADWLAGWRLAGWRLAGWRLAGWRLAAATAVELRVFV